MTENCHQQSRLLTLTTTHQLAIDLLMMGYSDRETGERVGVARETITRWRLYHPRFRAELQNRQREMQNISKARLMIATQKAIGVVEDMIIDTDNPARGRMAMDLIKTVIGSSIILRELPILEAEDIIQSIAIGLSLEDIVYPLNREANPHRAAAIDRIRELLEGDP